MNEFYVLADLAGDLWDIYTPKYLVWWLLVVFAIWLFYRGLTKKP